MYERFDKAKPVAPTKGEFSFLIAFARQLDRALELGEDAPEFLGDALDCVAYALAHLLGEERGVLPDTGGDDDGVEDDDDSSGGLQSQMADGEADQPVPGRGAPGHRPPRAVGGAVPGGRVTPATPLVTMRRVQSLQSPQRATSASVARKKGTARRGKKSKK